MKRTPLRRRTPLRSSGQLRSTPLRARRKAEPELDAAKVIRRGISGGMCERCGNYGDHFHHVWMRSQGGLHEWWNLRHLCFRCHGWVHPNPNESLADGWLMTRANGLATKAFYEEEHP